MKKEKIFESVKAINLLIDILRDTNPDKNSMNIVMTAKQSMSQRVDYLAIKELMKEACIGKILCTSKKFYNHVYHELEEANYHNPAEALFNLDKDILAGWTINSSKQKYIQFIRSIAEKY